MLARAFVCAAILLFPIASGADPCRPAERGRQRPLRIVSGSDGYAMFKAGGMMLNGAGSSSGGWFGVEVGRNAGGWFDAGLSLDWFHRRGREVELLFETEGDFDPPIRGEVTRFESSTDFVPLGVTMRLRLPGASEVVTPFISGTLAYEILHLSFYDRERVAQPYDDLLGDTQTLMGFGWQMAGGVEVAITPQLALFGEAGVHWSDPVRRLEDSAGSPVDLTASLHGGFLRTGLRLSR
jgi:hypothetical protein